MGLSFFINSPYFYFRVEKRALMIYLKKELTDNILLGIWKVEEASDDLLAMLDKREWLEDVFVAKSDSRKKEMLATRVLLKDLLGEEKQICYHPSGKPFLCDESYEIGISHTQGYVAIALHEQKTMGLDIEQCTNKIFRVRERLITRYDYIDVDNERDHLLLHWSAKEAMFKYLNAKGVDFRRNLHVEPFVPYGSGRFIVSESKTKERQHFDAHYIVEEDFVLVCLVERTNE